ncbi:lipid droplet-regulating VLDL assembly factor AUP1-like [Diorhabda sublineata]|uniref:lipid droplet-regulating VLDL assembly factor AUP1-like n=1 Tax=Diorhabda sublineata TaxID=1163346 RepID=UPI0024E1920A|nr:lipid droplet-regulating VLDL assembly factor AUP1-like [Diorhabda sublineata]
MANVEIANLLARNRIPDSDVSFIFFIFYLPLGLILIVLRCCLLLFLFLICQFLPDTPRIQKFVNKLACLGLGISVHVENLKVKEKVHVYISNSVSVFDQVAVCKATGAVSPSCRTTVERVLGFSTYCFGSIVNVDNFKNNLKQFMEERTPVYFAPEDKVTNGKALLKFKTYPFEFTNKVQPICITVDRPFLDISVTVMGSSYFSDLVYYLFSPVTNYRLTFLEPSDRKTMSDQEFAENVRRNMATALKVQTTNYTSNDVTEWEKRANFAPPRPQTRTRSLNTPELTRMGKQVKEVLPHVPLNAIYTDLYITRNVDSTITNILEGRVHFTPEQSSSSNNQPSTSGSSNCSSFSTAASSFPKSASERTKSFQERKEQLIATARRRYIEKHNLDIPI